MPYTKEEVLEEVSRLRKELRKAEAILETIEGIDQENLEGRTGLAMRFYGLRPQIAIDTMLPERDRGMTAEDLIQGYVDGGGTIGKKRDSTKPNNPRIAIEKLLNTGKLKKVGKLIGLPNWGPEKFEEPL